MTTSDIRITFPTSFDATTLGIEPISEAGREWFRRNFGSFAVSAEIYKSSGPSYEEAILSAGLRLEVRTGSAA